MGAGSYCQTYKPKSGTASMPWKCHLASEEESTIPSTVNDTEVVTGLPSGVDCKTDDDCPCSYCKNDKTKTAPYLCQAAKPGICCKTDTDCKANGAGSYGQTYKPKSGTASMPWKCHLASEEESTIPSTVNDTEVVTGLPSGVDCKTDDDCPCSYCKNDKTKTAPYLCQAAKPGICCKTDTDCKANGAGSYGQT